MDSFKKLNSIKFISLIIFACLLIGRAASQRQIIRRLQTCTDTNCATCPNSTSVCTSCNQGYIINNGGCYNSSNPPQGYYYDGVSAFAPCISGCLTCPNGTSCTNCDTSNSYYLFSSDNKCYTSSSPPLGYYWDGSTFTACITGCNSCSNTTTCGTCDDTKGYRRFTGDNKCYLTSSPPSKYYWDAQSSNFIQCITGCNACSNGTSCTTCDNSSNYYLLSADNKCYLSSNPPAGYFWNSNTFTACITGCNVCAGTSTCTTCNTGQNYQLFTSDNKCYLSSSPPSGYFWNTNTFSACITGCNVCSNTSSCTTCNTSSNYQLYTSDNKCYLTTNPPTGYFWDSTNSTFTACLTGCNVCSNATSCTTCNTGSNYQLFSVDKKCYVTTNPPTGYYWDTTNSVFTACITGCNVCSNTTICTTCNTSSNYQLYTSDNKCYLTTNPPTGYFWDSTNSTFTACITGCNVCSNATSCTTCNTGSNYQLFSVDKKCYVTTNPPTGYYWDSTNTAFTACVTGCNVCSNTTSCTTCNTSSNYQLFSIDNKCYLTTNPPSGYFWDSTNSTFTACITGCNVCSNISSCTTCNTSSNYQLYTSDNKCYLTTNPPTGYFWDSTSSTFTACLTGCNVCSNATSCTTCNTGSNYQLFSVDKKCYVTTNPPTGYYWNTANSVFTACVTGCNQCNDSLTCTTCNNSGNYYIYSDNKCYLTTSPPAGTYFDNTAKIFVPLGKYWIAASSSYGTCINNCDQCTTNTGCTLCSTGYAYFTQTQQCTTTSPPPDTFYYNGSTFAACVSNCKTCANTTACQVCNTNYYLFSNDNLCYTQTAPPKGYFYNTQTSSFSACITGCNICSNTSTCTTCDETSKYHIYTDNQCYLESKPPSTKFWSATGWANCPSNCLNCSSATTCTTCDTANGFLLFTDNLCYSKTSPPLGAYYDSVNIKFTSCITGCGVCADTTSCRTCLTNYVIFTDNKCYTTSTPPTDYYWNTSINNFSACITGCTNCSNSTSCLVCKNTTGYYILNSVCYLKTSPPTGFHFDTTNSMFVDDGKYYIPSTKGYGACITGCKICADDVSCSTCNTGYAIFTDNKCYLTTNPPPSYYYDQTNNKFSACDSSCKTCTNGVDCTSCANTYFPVAGNTAKCLTGTLNQYYFDTAASNYVPCYKTCLTCTAQGDINDNKCTSCGANVTLNGTMCTAPSCTLNQYWDVANGTCTNCDATCASCLSGTTCATCVAGYYQSSVNTICATCDTSCSTCLTATSCTKCASGYYALPTGGLCVKTCPAGYYIVNATDPSANNMCKPCTSPCQNCSTDAATCTTCIANYTLTATTCNPTPCSSGFYLNQAPIECRQCPTTCKDCSDQATCTTCNGTDILYIGKCYSKCPQGTYYSIDIKTCLACNINCSACTNGTKYCQTCQANTFKAYQITPVDGISYTCELSCPDGLLQDSTTMTCKTCQQMNKFIDLTGNCVDACPTGYFPDSANICKKCSDMGKYILLDQCLDSCPTNYSADSNKICYFVPAPGTTDTSSNTTNNSNINVLAGGDVVTINPLASNYTPPSCDPNPCKNSATCSATLFGISCECQIGYWGEKCDNVLNKCKTFLTFS
jgi:proprotein convertase subtilisin/kexin type 5